LREGFVRTLVVIAIGLVLSGAFVFASGYSGKGKVTGAIGFIVVWFIFCAADYSNGVKAGYAAIDELGIHILLFVVPTIGAWTAARFLP
jgi:hypothetical protein